MYEVTINMENLPEGADVEIDGLGRYKNGSTNEVTKEEADYFRLRHQTVAYSYDKKGNMKQEITPGPTVLEAFKGVDGINVVTKKEEKK